MGRSKQCGEFKFDRPLNGRGHLNQQPVALTLIFALAPLIERADMIFRQRSTLDALPTLPAARCQTVQRHGRLFLPCLPRQSNLRKPKKKSQSPRLSTSLQAAANAWRFAPGNRPHTSPTISHETTTISKTGYQN
jgi:hypothetical protein